MKATKSQVKPADSLKRKQCAKCPWKKSTDPHDIPNGYCETRHRELKNTIAEEGVFRAGVLPMMACHEAVPGKEVSCVGWLANQLGPGNNIGLRLAVLRRPELGRFTLDGEQHATFEDTLPKRVSERVGERRPASGLGRVPECAGTRKAGEGLGRRKR